LIGLQYDQQFNREIAHYNTATEQRAATEIAQFKRNIKKTEPNLTEIDTQIHIKTAVQSERKVNECFETQTQTQNVRRQLQIMEDGDMSSKAANDKENENVASNGGRDLDSHRMKKIEEGCMSNSVENAERLYESQISLMDYLLAS